MRHWRMTLETLQPVVISPSQGREIFAKTLDYIPGSAIRGAVGQQWKMRVGFGSTAADAFFEHGVWRDARLRGGQFRACSVVQCSACGNEADLAAEAAGGGMPAVHCPDCGGPRTARQEGWTFQPEVLMRKIQQIDPALGTVRIGRFHFYEALAAGQFYEADVYLPEESLRLVADEATEDGYALHVHIGKKTYSGYGKTRIAFVRQDETDEARIARIRGVVERYSVGLSDADRWAAGETFVLLVNVSPLLLTDRYMRPTASLDLEWHLSSLPGGLAERSRSWIRKAERQAEWGNIDHYGGWNGAWRLPKESAYGVKPGGISLFRFASLTEDERTDLVRVLADIERYGLGQRTNEGYGEFWICRSRMDAAAGQRAAARASRERADRMAALIREAASLLDGLPDYPSTARISAKFQEYLANDMDIAALEVVSRKYFRGWNMPITLHGHPSNLLDYLLERAASWTAAFGAELAETSMRAFMEVFVEMVGYKSK